MARVRFEWGCSTPRSKPLIPMTGRLPGVTSRSSASSPSRAHTFSTTTWL